MRITSITGRTTTELPLESTHLREKMPGGAARFTNFL